MTDNLLMYTVTILSAFLLYKGLFIFHFLKRSYVCYRALSQFPKADSHWFWGHFPVIRRQNEQSLKTLVEWTNRFTRCFMFCVGPVTPYLLLIHPDTIKLLTKTTEPKPSFMYGFLKSWTGDGLVTSSGKKWFRNRRLLNPCFHNELRKAELSVYNECVDTLIDRLKTCSVGQSVEIHSQLRLCTLNAILKCAFTQDENLQNGSDYKYADYFDNVSSGLELIESRVGKIHLFSDVFYKLTKDGKRFFQICKEVNETTRRVINERRKTMLECGGQFKPGHKTDLLDTLLLARDEDGRGLTEIEIQEEVTTAMAAGHDTTATAMTWTLYNLAQYPECQQQVHDELDGLLAGRSDRKITWDDLSNMPYLTMCIKESMRMYPPIPFIGRENTKPMMVDNKHVPTGSTIIVFIYGLHHNAAVWGNDHMIFKPQRFSKDNIAKMDSHAFLPFSAGPRNCIGQHVAMNEMKTVLARFLYEYKLTVDDTHRVELQTYLSLRAKNGIKLHLHKRTI